MGFDETLKQCLAHRPLVYITQIAVDTTVIPSTPNICAYFSVIAPSFPTESSLTYILYIFSDKMVTRVFSKFRIPAGLDF